MKNGSIPHQLVIQEQRFTNKKKKETFQSDEKENIISSNIDSKLNSKHSFNQGNHKREDFLLSIFSLEDSSNYDTSLAEELQAQKHKKRNRRFSLFSLFNIGFN